MDTLLVTCNVTLHYKCPDLVLPESLPDVLNSIGEVDDRNPFLRGRGVNLAAVSVVGYGVKASDGEGTSLTLTNEWTFECPDEATAKDLVSALADKSSPLEGPLSFDLEFEHEHHTWELLEGPETTCIIHP